MDPCIIDDSVEIPKRRSFVIELQWPVTTWVYKPEAANTVRALDDEWCAFPLSFDNGRSPHGCINQRLQIQSELLMMSGLPLETC
jgi:hypothetical protein